jgi:hypothetical protein
MKKKVASTDDGRVPVRGLPRAGQLGRPDHPAMSHCYIAAPRVRVAGSPPRHVTVTLRGVTFTPMSPSA